MLQILKSIGLAGVSALLAAQVGLAQADTYNGTLNFSDAVPTPVTFVTATGIVTANAGLGIQRFYLGNMIDGASTQISFTQESVNPATTMLGVLITAAPNDDLLSSPSSIGGLINPASNVDSWLNANVTNWRHIVWGNKLINGGTTDIDSFFARPLLLTSGTDYYAFILGGSVYPGPQIGDANVEFSLNVAAVPEPEAWASLLIGLGIIGLLERKRRTTGA